MGAFLKHSSLHTGAPCWTLKYCTHGERHSLGYLMNAVDDVIVQQLLFLIVQGGV